MPRVTSEAAASSQSGEKPNAAIEPSSTALPGGLARRELADARLELVRRRRAIDPADELDRHPEEILRGRLVQPRPAHEARQQQLCRLVDDPADGGRQRSHEPLGQRGEEGETGAHR